MNLRVAMLATLVCFVLAHGARATTYEVGPGQPLANVGAVPWEKLLPGDTVLIHARNEPYREKFVICRAGKPDAPITVRGVPDANGRRPVISGDGATTRPELKYWGDVRSVIKIGGAMNPRDTMPRHIVIENLEIRSARPPYKFTDADGKQKTYDRHAAGITVEKAEQLVIRNCMLHDCGNGLFVSSNDERVSRDILVEGNYLFDNGNVGSGAEHNSYTAAAGITFQYNRYGPLRAGCPGINLKDRSAGTVVRYNWIEGGNLQLSLVEAEDSKLLRADPRYRQTFVYGNVLLALPGDGAGIVARYGGDSLKPGTFRKGMLYFYNNTVISRRTNRTILFKLSTDEERCDLRNNIFYTPGLARNLQLAQANGIFALSHNWAKSGWKKNGRSSEDVKLLTGDSPGFADEARSDFQLATNSPCIRAGGPLPEGALPANAVGAKYTRHQGGAKRLQQDRLNIGAF